MHRLRSRYILSLWLALSLLAAPLASVSGAAPADAAVPAAATDAGAHALHAGHAADPDGAAGSHAGTSCAQHEQCSGKCCAACAQCFTAAATVPVSFSTVLAVYSPTERSLHDRLTVAPHDRPPAV